MTQGWTLWDLNRMPIEEWHREVQRDALARLAPAEKQQTQRLIERLTHLFRHPNRSALHPAG